MPTAAERRDDERVPFASRVMIVRGECAWFAQLLDLSTGGCGVFRPEGCPLAEDELVRLFFYQDDGVVAVNVPARVARADEHRVGFEYHDPQLVPPTRA
ncbi:PilZ domain-containing protein [Agrilutibacter solisilvae]|uniref:PilZ domain-containing protein n=1 Tax=Agrilutibacter solisilvae TaxID=2763317 RepID=A0A974XX77_9GAMM|nr:PilZ domain-containing protein [Lysobacter solisilvae]QSX77459.1 PilZ domain-containing protein [Lysobacter solisilvae]